MYTFHLFICKCNFFYGNMHWTLKWWGCCEGMKLLLKWKNERFCGRNEREWKKLHSLVAGTWNETGAVNEWKLISFIYGSWSSFLQHLPVVHDVNGSYQLSLSVQLRELWCSWVPEGCLMSFCSINRVFLFDWLVPWWPLPYFECIWVQGLGHSSSL